MPKWRRIATLSSLVAFGWLYSIQVGELHLRSYLPRDVATAAAGASTEDDGVAEGASTADDASAASAADEAAAEGASAADAAVAEGASTADEVVPVPESLEEWKSKRAPPRRGGHRAPPTAGVGASRRTVRRASQFLSRHSQRHRSPACRPHFNAWTRSNRLSNATTFRRLYFYHARKAGGTSLANYLSKVARRRGLAFAQDEWVEAEEPGTHPVPTLYVAHLREPVSEVGGEGRGGEGDEPGEIMSLATSHLSTSFRSLFGGGRWKER